MRYGDSEKEARLPQKSISLYRAEAKRISHSIEPNKRLHVPMKNFSDTRLSRELIGATSGEVPIDSELHVEDGDELKAFEVPKVTIVGDVAVSTGERSFIFS